MKKSVGRPRKEEERAADIDLISQMYLKGLSATEMVAAFESSDRPYTLSRKTIVKDLEEAQIIWRDLVAKRVGEVKAQELARIDLIEAEAWAEWARSKEDAEETLTENVKGESGSKVKVSVRKRGRLGANEFLRTVQWCVEMRLKIHGVFQAMEEGQDFISDMAIKVKIGEVDPADVMIAYPNLARQILSKAGVSAPTIINVTNS